MVKAEKFLQKEHVELKTPNTASHLQSDKKEQILNYTNDKTSSILATAVLGKRCNSCDIER